MWPGATVMLCPTSTYSVGVMSCATSLMGCYCIISVAEGGTLPICQFFGRGNTIRAGIHDCTQEVHW